MSRSLPIFRRNVNGVGVLVDVAVEHGVSARRVLAGSGLKQSDLANTALTIAFADEFHVIRNLMRHCAHVPALGLEVGLRYRITTLASLGFVLVSSPTLRTGIDVFLRYTDLNASMARPFREGDGADVRIGFIERDLPPDIRAFAVERSVGVGIGVTAQLLGRPLVPRRVELMAARPSGAERYRRLLGVAPTFSAARNLLVYGKADVDTSLAQANPLAQRMAEDYCANLLATQRSRDGVAGLVRDRIARTPRAIPEMGVVASELFLTERTLRRRLALEGVTYQSLCLEVRHVIAERLLAVPDLTIKQVADRVGYSEPAAFTHAFRRWKGETPRAYRRRMR